MEYEDRLKLRTPEGVDLELVLAGMGSRMIGGLFDLTTQGLLALAYYLIASGLGLDQGLTVAGWAIVVFLLLFGYDVGFEVLARGRTPGKRIAGLRVLRADGRPIGLVTSSIRNVLRLIDILPFAYGVGVCVIFVTPRNQRLGDLVAGSVVVRERLGGREAAAEPDGALSRLVAKHEQLAAAVDVSAVGDDEILTLRRFLQRRGTLAPEACDRLAGDLAERVRPKLSGAPPNMPAESLLELVVAAKMVRRDRA